MRIIGAVLALVFALPAALLPHTAEAAGSWSIVTSPNTSTSYNNYIEGVSCVSASFCMAAGYYTGSTSVQTLIEQWNGTAWSIVTSANTSTSQTNKLWGVSCVSTTDCWAVGNGALHISGTWYDQALAEQWNGTSWSIVTTADAGTKQANYLYGVSCYGASFCMASGYYDNSGATPQTLIEQWGTAWSVVTSPNASTQMNYLQGVSCVSASSCMAAGYYVGSTSYEQTLIEQWNGTAWSIVTSPNTSTTQSNLLMGVSCASTSSCMADGYYNTGTYNQTLIEQWGPSGCTTTCSWSIVTSPNTSTTQDNDLYGVSCTSATFCMASGYYTTGYETLIEQWNGTAWSIVTSGTTTYEQLQSVSCVSTSFCMAAGYQGVGAYNQTLIEQYTPGASTTTVTSSSSPSTYGTSVTFTATVTPASPVPTGTITFTDTTNGMTLCSAVAVNGSGQATCATTGVLAGANTITAAYSGDSGYLASSGTVTQTVNCGSSVWCLDSSPNTSTTQSNQLQSVSCFSATFCMAAGYYYTGSYQTLIEQWNGTAWSIVTSPNTSTGQNNKLQGVSCFSATFCMAVGYYMNSAGYYQTLIEQWNGTAWSIVTSPNNGTLDNDLYGVSCVSTSFCMASGYYNTGSYSQTLIEQWNGTAWSIVTSPNNGATQSNYLQGVSCFSATSCMASGYYNPPSYYQTLIEQWNGTAWSIVTSPNTSTTQNNILYGVSCASTTSCMAAGEYIGTNNQTLIEQWNGTAWSIVTSPNVGTNQVNYLLGVSCASATSCMAAGYYNPGTYSQTLIEQWNGTAWSIVTSLNTSTTQDNELNGVSCGATFCMAAGYYVNSSNYDRTLIEEYTVASGGNLTITAPGAVNLGSSILPGSAVSNAALGGLAYQNSLADGMSWSVTLAATDLYNSGNSKLVAFTNMKIGVGQTISPSGPTAGTAGPTTLSGTDTTPGTSFSNSLTLASGTSAQQGSWTQTGNTITVNFPANSGNSGTMTSTIQYTITG